MRALLRTALLALALGLALGPALSMAQPADQEGDRGADGRGAEDPDDSRATSFRAVTGPGAEDVSGGTLLIAAYAVLWALIFGYVLRLGRLEARTRADVNRLERGLAEGSGAGGTDEA